MYLAILGFVMLTVFVVLLFKEKATPGVILISLPLIAGILAGYDLETLTAYIKTGVSSVMSNCVLFCFAILFFTVMSEAGLFTPIISKLMGMIGKSVSGICIAATLIAVTGHLDGSATTTIFITLPFFGPIFKKLKLKPETLVFLIGTTMGIMNLTPWAGTLMRVSTATGLDINYLWHRVLPMQITALVLLLIFAYIYGKRAEKAGVLADVEPDADSGAEMKPITWKFYFNLALTISTILILALTKITSYIVFMLAAIIALIVNFPNQKEQGAIIKKAAPQAYFIIVTMLGSGVFIGIMGQGEPSILNEMANVLLSILPAPLMKQLHLILIVLGVPLGLVFSGDALMYGVLPLCVEVGASYGISAETIGLIMAVGDSISIIGSPVYPSTYLILSMAGVELRDYLKYAFVPMWLMSLAMIASGIIFGIIPL